MSIVSKRRSIKDYEKLFKLIESLYEIPIEDRLNKISDLHDEVVNFIYSKGMKKPLFISMFFAYETHTSAMYQIEKRRSEDKSNLFVYFLQNQGKNKIKIGITSNIENRLKQISGSSMESIHLLFYFPAIQSVETQLHRRFKKSRVNMSEWFILTPDLSNFLDTAKTLNGVLDERGHWRIYEDQITKLLGGNEND